MYIDYSKLWKLLIDKNMSKTDLMELTGISSRVLAKLSKNQTVTTDTIARICEALNCDVADIMECASEKALSIYATFKKSGKCTEETELYRTVRFSMGEKGYTVYQSRQTANKATHIHCDPDGAVRWEQFYHPSGHIGTTSAKSILIKPQKNDRDTVIILIKGKPAVITGLDENGFVSSRSTPKMSTDVYVMSEAAFKLFNPDTLINER